MENILTEEWRDIKGYEECYQISNTGKVKSLKRKVNCKRANGKSYQITVSEKILKPGTDSDGYKLVNLYSNGSGKIHKIHKLVVDAFVGECPGTYGVGPNMYSVDHVNEITSDNTAENLRWLISTVNSAKGAKSKKRKFRPCKLNEEDIIKIRNDYREVNVIAKEYGVGKTTIVYILQNKTWKDIPYANKENQIAARKNNRPRGSNHKKSKLSEDQVKKIREDNRSYKNISKEYNISVATVSLIKNKKIWQHL